MASHTLQQKCCTTAYFAVAQSPPLFSSHPKLTQVEPESRGPVGDALAAYASISDKQLLSNLYRVTLQKYQKVWIREDMRAQGGVAGVVWMEREAVWVAGVCGAGLLWG